MSARTETPQWFEDSLPGMSVFEGELAAVTGDASDTPLLNALVPVLNRLRGAFGMDMVFIGQVCNGNLSGRATLPDSDCDPFEAAYGRELLEARCGSSMFEAVSVRSDEGIESGTLVCGVAPGDGCQGPPASLKSVSRLLATSMRRMARV
jgi:hypothetical protein